MEKLKLRKSVRKRILTDSEYYNMVSDILENEAFKELIRYPHHGHIDSLSHCVHVSYVSFRLGRMLHLDTKVLARGALFHDFYLYNWHIRGSRKGFHGLTHPKTAYNNAALNFTISDKEKDIILKHMWPLTIALPKYKESYIVMMADKYCSIVESFTVK